MKLSAGIFAGLGVTLLAPVLFPISIYGAIYKRKFEFPGWLLIIIISLTVSIMIHAPLLSEPYFILIALVGGGLTLPALIKHRSFYLGLTFGISLVSISILFDTSYRPDGLFKNALAGSQITSLIYIGSSGNILLPFIAGYTASRTPLLMLLSSYFILPKWFYILGILLFFGGFALQSMKSDTNRFAMTAIEKELARRTDINEATVESVPSKYPTRTFRPWGYGIANYKPSLGIQRPHNAALSLWWQMGLVSIPIMLTLLWAAIRKLGWRATLPLIPAFLLDDFLLVDVSGVITLMFYVTLLKYRSQAA